MILFKAIRYRNFLSSGNQFTEIKLNQSKTTLIVGTNGSGKSTILDALCFCLFNKAFRKITKSQLINSTNEKECVVELDFLIGKTDWKVVRGIKPALFEIYKNGSLLDQLASSNDQQKWLEENVLKLNYKSFTQIVILGSASFVPFMQLTTSHRREVVEDLLDIKIFSSMNSIIKDKIRNTNEKLRNSFMEEEMVEEKIKMQEEFIKNIEDNGNQEIDDKNKKIENISNLIDEIEKENEKQNVYLTDKLEPKLKSLSGSTKKLKQLSNLKGKLSQKVEISKEEYDFFSKNEVCPTCTQKIENDFRLNKISESESKVKEIQNGYNELNELILQEEQRESEFNDISKKIVRLNNEISNNNVKITHLNKQTRELEQEIQSITSKIKNRNIERDELKKLKQKLSKIKKQNLDLKEKSSYLDFAHHLLKDGGIKAKLIKKYLPLMNQQINKYLQMMDFYINFNLDEEFKENIKTPVHEDFTYESFSEGEKMRINLAILFTWREIARMKNSINTNLLILDEVFDSSLDDMGTDYFAKIIRYIIKDSNIFVISHKTEELIDKFDKVVKFNKIKGFSKIIN